MGEGGAPGAPGGRTRPQIARQRPNRADRRPLRRPRPHDPALPANPGRSDELARSRGRSMRDWLGRMGLSWGGETGKALREQATRIAHCSLKFFWEGEATDGWVKGGFVRSGLRFHAPSDDARQADLWEDLVVL